MLAGISLTDPQQSSQGRSLRSRHFVIRMILEVYAIYGTTRITALILLNYRLKRSLDVARFPLECLSLGLPSTTLAENLSTD